MRGLVGLVALGCLAVACEKRSDGGAEPARIPLTKLPLPVSGNQAADVCAPGGAKPPEPPKPDRSFQIELTEYNHTVK